MSKLDETKKSDLRKRSFSFSIEIISLVGAQQTDRVTDILFKQLVRSATSIGANIHEAKGASSRKDFKKFYEIALKSANETVYWLHILKESNRCSEDAIGPLLDECEQLARMLASSVIKIKKSL